MHVAALQIKKQEKTLVKRQMQKITTTVAINETGHRIGDSHPRAKLTNREVELLLRLRLVERWTYVRLAAKFGVSKSCVAWICQGRKRCQTPAAWKSVHLTRKR